MSELLFWTVGSTLAAVLVLITVAVAVAGLQYARQRHDPDLERSAKHSLLMCLIGLVLVLLCLIAAVFAYTRLLREWVVWLLVAIPWVIALMNGLQVAYIWRISRVQNRQAEADSHGGELP